MGVVRSGGPPWWALGRAPVPRVMILAFPDLRIDLSHLLACGESSVLEGTLRGTHRADLGPIPATGKTIELGLCDVIEVRDGKVHREREYFDQMTMMQQLGVTPAE
jgi:steroid delta-isomerase-like uncharacterized protein